MGLAGPSVANTYQALVDGAKALKEVRVGGSFEIKTYNQKSGAFAAAYNFDTLGFVWTTATECLKGGAQEHNLCCGHQIFDRSTLSSKPLLSACGSKPVAGQSCAEVTGTISAQSASNTNFNISINEATLQLVYGQLVRTALENVIFPKIFPRSDTNGDGVVAFSEVTSHLCPSGAAVGCAEVARVVGEMILNFIDSLATQGSGDVNAKFSITGAQMIDTDADDQPDKITGQIAIVAATGSGSSADASAEFNALAIRGTDECGADRACGTGRVCRFGKNQVDSCFSRNTCVRPVGTRAGAAACSTDLDCRSGVCAEASNKTVDIPGRCVQICGAYTDCTAGTCKKAATIAVDSNGAGTEFTTFASTVGVCVAN